MMQPPSRREFPVRVFLPGGDPGDIQVVEKSNWTGCGLVVPRLSFNTPTLAPKAMHLILKANGIEARGFESPKGFVVRAGSKAVKKDKEAPSIHAYLKETRAELVRQGVLVDRRAVYELAQDYAFSSPSIASGVLLGRSSNGRVEWRTADGRTLKSVQDTEVGA